MQATKIYLIRHGESEANSKNVFIGHTDMDITEKGHLQAQAAAEYLADVHADVIYSSDLIRAYNTARHTAEKKNLPIIKTEGLREIFSGLWENLTYEEVEKKYTADRELWRTNVGLSRPTGGESVVEVQARVLRTLKDIAVANLGKSILCFSHALVIRAISAYFMGLSPEEMKNIPWADNASVTEIEYKDGEFSVVRYGYDEHLRTKGLNYVP